ncbi:YfjI family protein [Kordiimonas sp.]|uniref:YfjI family protein n=1 Tax=Kordiimonas sp. TaxID=1970157 RepID=UPI003A9138B4
MRDVLAPRLAQWVEDAAEAKGAPPDYVFAALLAVAGATIGNTRWVSPWKGWNEPPVIWSMCIGLPSAGKSPAIDAALQPLRKAERPLRDAAEAERKAWAEKAELAKLAESTWKEAAKGAIKAGDTPPEKPQEADAGQAPHIPRLVVNDGTIERLGAILARQPRGTLQMRDELAGWLDGMLRYSGGGSDRPFWLEAFGGRGFTVERMGREPLTIDRLTIGVLGGIQPDRLKTLLFKSDDDGLLARFLPIWPDPAPLRRPRTWADELLMERALERLLSLDMVTDDQDETRPWFIPFAEDARGLMDDFRSAVRDWEGEAEGLMLSFIGKLPGLAARLSLVQGYLDWAAGEAEEPHEITASEFGRAAHLVEAYFLPMARRAYADAATPKADRAARRLVGIIQEQGWQSFTARDVMRLDRQELGSKKDVDPALSALEDGECIRPVEAPPNPQGGRPQRLYAVNPTLHRGRA